MNKHQKLTTVWEKFEGDNFCLDIHKSILMQKMAFEKNKPR